jgi:hypothetical protein
VQFCDERVSSDEMMKLLNDTSFRRTPEMIRALVPACVSLQIPVKMGMKLVAQTAALFWSVDHVFCNFEVGRFLFYFADIALFLAQWLRSIERDGTASLTSDESRIVSLLRDLLLEADPDADTRDPMSSILLTVWADQFDGVNVWGSILIHWPLLMNSHPESGKDFQSRCRCNQNRKQLCNVTVMSRIEVRCVRTGKDMW